MGNSHVPLIAYLNWKLGEIWLLSPFPTVMKELEWGDSQSFIPRKVLQKYCKMGMIFRLNGFVFIYIYTYIQYKYTYFKSQLLPLLFKCVSGFPFNSESICLLIIYFLVSHNITLVVSKQWHLSMLQNGHKLAHSLTHAGVIN